MTIVFQKSVTADNTYSYVNNPSNVLFDVHNDSPYNMGISFGRNSGIQDADYYTSPQSVLYGIPIPGQAGRSVGGSRFSGTIYIYTQTPLGGTTTFSAAPAQSITILGYPAGSQPQGTTSLNRMANVGNPVTTSGGSVAQIVNDGNPANTQIIEATVTGDGSSAVSLKNDGTLVLGNATHTGSISSDNAKFKTDGSGNVTGTSFNSTDVTTTSVVANAGTYNAINLTPASNNVGMVFYGRDNTGTAQIAASFNPTALNYEIYEPLRVDGTVIATGDITTGGTLHKTNTITDSSDNSWAAVTAGTVTRIANATQVALQVPGGSTVLSVVSNAINCSQPVACGQFNLTGSSGNYSLYTNSLSRWSDFSGTGSVTVNHNLGATPSFAWCWCDAAASSQTMGNTQTSTQVTVTAGAGLHWHGCAVRY